MPRPRPRPWLRDPVDAHVQYVINTSRVWRRKSLRVCFTADPGRRQRQIADIASSWTAAGGPALDFAFPSDGKPRFCNEGESADIRINVRTEAVGHSSAIGNELLGTNHTGPTMTLSGLGALSPAETRWVVLHEFGHALGFEHESRHTQCKDAIDWKRLMQYAKTLNWTERQAHAQFDTIPEALAYPGAVYKQTLGADRDSVMAYALPSDVAAHHCSGAKLPDLSDLDRQGVRIAYDPTGWPRAALVESDLGALIRDPATSQELSVELKTQLHAFRVMNSRR